MSGIPVIVSGKSHYRKKGFTLDPSTWDEYFSMLEETLADIEKYKLSQEQVNLAWNYAYRFFFNYPCPFPWHLHFWDELSTWPFEKVLSVEGQKIFADTFRYLVGETRDWKKENL